MTSLPRSLSPSLPPFVVRILCASVCVCVYVLLSVDVCMSDDTWWRGSESLQHQWRLRRCGLISVGAATGVQGAVYVHYLWYGRVFVRLHQIQSVPAKQTNIVTLTIEAGDRGPRAIPRHAATPMLMTTSCSRSPFLRRKLASSASPFLHGEC